MDEWYTIQDQIKKTKVYEVSGSTHSRENKRDQAKILTKEVLGDNMRKIDNLEILGTSRRERPQKLIEIVRKGTMTVNLIDKIALRLINGNA